MAVSHTGCGGEADVFMTVPDAGFVWRVEEGSHGSSRRWLWGER